MAAPGAGSALLAFWLRLAVEALFGKMPDKAVHFKAFVEPAFYKNAYVVYRRDHGPCWIIDPGLAPQPEQICAFLQRHDLTPELILLTHGHADHIAGLGPLKQAFTTAKVLISHQDRPMLSDPDLNLSASFSVPLVVGL